MNSIEAMKQALEALETERDKYMEWGDEDGAPEEVYDAITAMRQALAQQPADEPVAWVNSSDVISSKVNRERGGHGDTHTWSETKNDYHKTPLYTTPPAAPVQEPVAGQGKELSEKLKLCARNVAFVAAGRVDMSTAAMREMFALIDHVCAALDSPPAAQPASVQDDIADFIAGAFGVSRGTAYDLMREALKEAAPVQEPYGYVSTHTSGLMHFNKTFHGVYTDTATEIVAVYTHPAPAAQPAPAQEPIYRRMIITG